MSLIEYITFSLLTLAFLLLWLREYSCGLIRHTWLLVLSLACVSAIYAGLLQFIGILMVILAGLLAWMARNRSYSKPTRYLAGILFMVSALMLGSHMMPGIHSILVFDQVILSTNASPYSLYFNFDKTLVGLFILGLWYRRPKYILSWSATGLELLRWLPLLFVPIILLAILIGYIRFEPKRIDGLWMWMWANLFFTCTAEEALFRGVIQHQLAQFLSARKNGQWLACGIAAVLFGLAHIGGGSLYVLISTVAGFGYGAIYILTGRIEASIVTHFTLNLIHVLFFTYPALTTF